MSKNIEPDEFGRYRVLDEDTGAKRSVVESQLPHGNHKVLDEPASDVGGDALPVEYPAPKPASAAREGYGALKKADLELAVANRNKGRDEANLIIVAEPGNKPDLIAALEADDTTPESLSSTTPSGQQADPEEENAND